MEEKQIDQIFAELSAPFPAKSIHWRVGAANKERTKGLSLAYVDARDVMWRLDRTVGPANWQDDYKEVLGRLVCEIQIKVDGEWISKRDGAGDTQVEAEKGGLSDAFKRAGVKWGIGRYLYYLPQQWVELDDRGRIKNPPELPKWALPMEEGDV